jgi:hypothetical protein
MRRLLALCLFAAVPLAAVHAQAAPPTHTCKAETPDASPVHAGVGCVYCIGPDGQPWSMDHCAAGYPGWHWQTCTVEVDGTCRVP